MTELSPTAQVGPRGQDLACGVRANPSTRSDPPQIVLIRACLCGRGACADFTLKPAGVIETNPTEWPPLPLHQHTHTSHSLHHTAGACGGAGADGREPDGGRTLSSGALGNALGRGEGERIGRPIVHVAIIDYPNGNGPSHLGEQALGG